MRSKRNDQRLIQGLIHTVGLQAIMTAPPTPPEIHTEILRRRHEVRRAMEEARERRMEKGNDIFSG